MIKLLNSERFWLSLKFNSKSKLLFLNLIQNHYDFCQSNLNKKFYKNISFLNTCWCFSQSVFMAVDVLDSLCFRAKSWCFCGRCFKSQCFRSRTNGATRILISSYLRFEKNGRVIFQKIAFCYKSFKLCSCI